jgi:hypothetical protein
MNIETWNVLSPYQPDALKMLLEQLDNRISDITAMQKMRLIDEGVTDCVLQLSKEIPHIWNRFYYT